MRGWERETQREQHTHTFLIIIDMYKHPQRDIQTDSERDNERGRDKKYFGG